MTAAAEALRVVEVPVLRVAAGLSRRRANALDGDQSYDAAAPGARVGIGLRGAP